MAVADAKANKNKYAKDYHTLGNVNSFYNPSVERGI